MARVRKVEEFDVKRNQILDAVQMLVYTKGYERMTIQDILDHLQISKGAFYHYFDSKPAVLEAFIERMREETEKPLLPIIRDPELSAIEKLRGFFDTLDNLRLANRSDIIKLGQVWYTDENAIVRQKVDEAIIKQRGPLLVEIVQQGIQESVFSTDHPEQSGEIILSLLQGMGNAHAKLIFFPDPNQDKKQKVEKIISIYNAYMDAIGRVVGAPANSLQRTDLEAVETWMTDSNNEE